MKIVTHAMFVAAVTGFIGCGGSGGGGDDSAQSLGVRGEDVVRLADDEINRGCAVRALTNASEVFLVCPPADSSSETELRIWTRDGAVKTVTSLPPGAVSGIRGFTTSGYFFGSYTVGSQPTQKREPRGFIATVGSFEEIPQGYSEVVGMSESGQYSIASKQEIGVTEVISREGQIIPLAQPRAGVRYYPFAVNDDGIVTGIAIVGRAEGTFADHYAFLQQKDSFKLLPRPSGARAAYGTGVLDDGAIVVQADFSNTSQLALRQGYLFSSERLMPVLEDPERGVAALTVASPSGALGGGFADAQRPVWIDFIKLQSGSIVWLQERYPDLTGQLRVVALNDRNEAVLERYEPSVTSGGGASESQLSYYFVHLKE